MELIGAPNKVGHSPFMPKLAAVKNLSFAMLDTTSDISLRCTNHQNAYSTSTTTFANFPNPHRFSGVYLLRIAKKIDTRITKDSEVFTWLSRRPNFRGSRMAHAVADAHGRLVPWKDRWHPK